MLILLPHPVRHRCFSTLLQRRVLPQLYFSLALGCSVYSSRDEVMLEEHMMTISLLGRCTNTCCAVRCAEGEHWGGAVWWLVGEDENTEFSNRGN